MKLLDVVALLEGIPEEGLKRGEVGTVVEVFEDKPDRPGAFLIEFNDDMGKAYAFVALPAEKLMPLYYRRHEPA
ncbi:MAG: DUF4926 domain-containing protein [Acidobacteriota bacterium]|nr:DUF4926 domain-containing protein [Acidobacteriota bacterium]